MTAPFRLSGLLRQLLYHQTLEGSVRFLQDEINSNRRKQDTHAEIAQHDGLIFRLIHEQRQNQSRRVAVYEAESRRRSP